MLGLTLIAEMASGFSSSPEESEESAMYTGGRLLSLGLIISSSSVLARFNVNFFLSKTWVIPFGRLYFLYLLVSILTLNLIAND